ncbi:ZIP family metal transporter [Metabacillus litoralis]|uniref:ZIP family metal transporter n=1 Tax=Metabacillus litoralis TaxID=152268 RepID=UPI001CFF42F0|nr:ZIP family metal transporter [Metabacillus litoralis]
MGFLFCLAVFMSLLGGAVFANVTCKWLNMNVHYVTSICAGILCGFLFLELIPHSFLENEFAFVLVGIALGFPLVYCIDQYAHNQLTSKMNQNKFSFYFLILAITLHNVPSGLTLGNRKDGSGHLLEFIIFHHFPEGMSLMMVAMTAFLKKRQILLAFAFLSVSLYSVVLLGVHFPVNDSYIIGVLLGFSISTFVYVAIFELLLPAVKYGSKSFHLLCALTGFFIVQVLLLIG